MNGKRSNKYKNKITKLCIFPDDTLPDLYDLSGLTEVATMKNPVGFQANCIENG